MNHSEKQCCSLPLENAAQWKSLVRTVVFLGSKMHAWGGLLTERHCLQMEQGRSDPILFGYTFKCIIKRDCFVAYHLKTLHSGQLLRRTLVVLGLMSNKWAALLKKTA